MFFLFNNNIFIELTENFLLFFIYLSLTGITLSHNQQTTVRHHEQQPADVTRKRKRKRNISIYSFFRSLFYFYYFYTNNFQCNVRNSRSCSCRKKSAKNFFSSALILPIFFLLLHFRIGFASVAQTTTTPILVNAEPGQNLTATPTATTTTSIVNNSKSTSRNDKNKNIFGSTITQREDVVVVRRQHFYESRHKQQQLQSDQPQLLPLVQQQPCSISELTCTNGKCVPLNKYCDNINDCGDSSDEPRFCTSEYLFLFVIFFLKSTDDTLCVV